MSETRPIMVEIERAGRVVQLLRSDAVPSVGDEIHWDGTHRVRVVSRDWIIDTDDVTKRNAFRCVLVCKDVRRAKAEGR